MPIVCGDVPGRCGATCISTQLGKDTKSGFLNNLQGFLRKPEFIKKNILYKPFFKKGLIQIFLVFQIFLPFFSYVSPARAGIFSSIGSFFFGTDAGNSASIILASVTLPLLGSVNASPLDAEGIGGPEDSSAAIPVMQDSALVAPMNPAGTLPSDANDEIFIYTVVQGDVPSLVAQRFGISLNTLLWANNIRNPDLIKEGDELAILPVTGVRYEVKAGDTLDSIAKKFKGDPTDIINFNGLVVGEALEPGTILIIPDGELDTPPAPRPASGGVSRYAGLPVYRGYYMRPVLGGRNVRATSANPHGIHGYNGVDLANSCGSPVLAAAEGTIILARSSGWNGGYGRYMVLRHVNGTQTLYAHLTSVLGSVNQYVAQGSQIATVGTTGNSTGCHLHFEIRGATNPF